MTKAETTLAIIRSASCQCPPAATAKEECLRCTCSRAYEKLVEENEACKQQMAIECEEKHKAKEDARKMQECLEAIEHEEVPCPARYLCDRDMCRDKGDDVDIYDLAKKTLSSLTTNYLDD